MSLQINKCDPELGLKIHNFLLQKGVETPGVRNISETNDEIKIKSIAGHFSDIMQILGLDLKNDSLRETPQRVAKMYIHEFFWGLKPENFPICTLIENAMHYDEMIVEKDILLMSNCEHHFVPIEGKAHVAYIPKDKIIGLSKINRVVEYFARRPQVQERISEQIYHALSYILETKDVAVVIEAAHSCVKMRGVEDCGSLTVTAKLGGYFRERPETRAEFMALIRKG